MKDYKQKIFITLATGTLLFTSSVHAADLTASNPQPQVIFTDTDIPADTFAMGSGRFGNNNDFFLTEQSTSLNTIYIRNPLASEENLNSLLIGLDAPGDISLANRSVYIDKSEQIMGIGTITPGEGLGLTEPKLHLKSTTGFAGIIQEGNGSTWKRDNGSVGAFISRLGNGGADVVKLFNTAPDNSITATDIGVGIGVEVPTSKLDVAGKINAVFDGSSSKNLQQLFAMSANNSDSGQRSDAGFVVENARANFSYAFRTLEKFTRPGETVEIDGGFAISKQATGEQELVIINPTTNDPTKVELHLSSGASNVNGQWVNASSRSYKKNIHELSGDDAMQAMRGLKSVTYEFKQDAGKEKMIGFIAEDVPELLATKTRKTVDPLRIVAVLTKAVQEQDKALTSKDIKIAEMEARAVKNTSRLEKLESQLLKLMRK